MVYVEPQFIFPLLPWRRGAPPIPQGVLGRVGDEEKQTVAAGWHMKVAAAVGYRGGGGLTVCQAILVLTELLPRRGRGASALGPLMQREAAAATLTLAGGNPERETVA